MLVSRLGSYPLLRRFDSGPCPQQKPQEGEGHPEGLGGLVTIRLVAPPSSPMR